MLLSQVVFDDLTAWRDSERQAKADTGRAAMLAEAEALERRAAELREKAGAQ